MVVRNNSIALAYMFHRNMFRILLDKFCKIFTVKHFRVFLLLETKNNIKEFMFFY